MIGIGGSSIEIELVRIKPLLTNTQPIEKKEFEQRVQKASRLMREE